MEKTRREIFTKEKKKELHPQQGMWRRCALDLSLEVNLKGAQRSLHKIITWTKKLKKDESGKDSYHVEC
jgi:hypothetical protein